MLKAWEGVFPGLVKPASDVSPDLQAHFRYPQDLFEILDKVEGIHRYRHVAMRHFGPWK